MSKQNWVRAPEPPPPKPAPPPTPEQRLAALEASHAALGKELQEAIRQKAATEKHVIAARARGIAKGIEVEQARRAVQRQEARRQAIAVDPQTPMVLPGKVPINIRPPVSA